jgi:antitoxin component of MazEF toxin-antitoxin module
MGKSRGICIPEPFIKKCRFGNSVELNVENGCIVISAERRARQGWDKVFRIAGSSINDEFLLNKIGSNKFDYKEWRW